MKQVKVLYDFEAVEENELSLSTGEVLQVIDDNDPNWWRGMSDRGIGYFPSSFVAEDTQLNAGTAISSEKTPLLKSTPIENVPCPPLVDLGNMPSAPMYSATPPTTPMMFKNSPAKIYAASLPMYSANSLGSVPSVMQSFRQVDENVITKCVEIMEKCDPIGEIPDPPELEHYERLCAEQAQVSYLGKVSRGCWDNIIPT